MGFCLRFGSSSLGPRTLAVDGLAFVAEQSCVVASLTVAPAHQLWAMAIIYTQHLCMTQIRGTKTASVLECECDVYLSLTC